MVQNGDRDRIKNTVKEAADIVQVIGEHVELKRAGARFTGLCPFHAERTPSFSVNPQGQFFHCFGCGESGDVFSFVMKHLHLDFPDALKMLADKYHIDLPERQLDQAEKEHLRRRQELYDANEAAMVLFQWCLGEEALGGPARAYLAQRGVPGETIARYRLGYAPAPDLVGWSYLTDRLAAKRIARETLERAGLSVPKDRGGYYDRFRSRVMFPLTDMTGRVVAFGGRILGDGTPKYLNSPESPIFDKSRLLFGLYEHRQAIRQRRQALVVEGNFDLLLLAVHGIDNVVAPLGTALSRHHVHSLRGYGDEVVLLFDADAAGLKAAMRSIPFFLAEQVESRVAILPSGHDPDSFVRSEGAEGIRRLVEHARPLAEFAFDTLVRQHGLTLAGKSRIIAELQPLVSGAADPRQRSLMIAHFSEKLGVSPGYFTQGEPVAREARSVVAAVQALGRLPRQERQLIDFLILYPEFLRELQAAGLAAAVRDPWCLRVLERLDQAHGDGVGPPESLLPLLTEEGERAYVSDLLTRISGEGIPDREHARQMCDELLAWLETMLRKQDVADLQAQIREAERLGNVELMMRLMQQKQELTKKRQDL